MNQFTNTLFNGAALGSVYGLVAVGIVVLFKSTGILNFAHGILMTTAAFIAAALTGNGVSFWVAAFMASVAVGALGGVMHLTAIRPLATRGLFAGVMVTLGLAEVIHGVLSIYFGPGQRLIRPPVAIRQIHIFGIARVSSVLAVCTATVLVAVVVLALGFRYTLVGVRLRGAASNPQLASSFGVNLTVLFAVAWMVSAALGGLAGVLLGTLSVVELTLGDFAFRAFAGIIVGGADSVPGALVGGMVVGIVELLAGTYLGSEYRLVMTMALLLAFLVVRPTGIFGSRRLGRA